MNRRPNRFVLLLVGLVLMGAGVTALLAATGVLRLAEPATIYERLTTSANSNPAAWAAATVAGAIVVAAVGAWLVRRQLRIRRGGRLGTVTLDRGERGVTTAEAAAIAGAAAADLRAQRGIIDSTVRMVTFGSRPRLRVHLAISADTDPRTALERAEAVYRRVGQVVGRPAVHVDTTVRPTATQAERVA